MAKGSSGFDRFRRDMESLVFLGAVKSAERIVKELQEEGPSWTGRFSNSYQITGPQGQQIKGDGGRGEPRPLKFSTGPFTGPQAVSTLIRTKMTKDKVVFKISNFSQWMGYATDQEQGVFYRPTEKPETQLGLKKWEESGQNRSKKPGYRWDIYGGDAGEASRTAEKDWYTTYKNSGKLDKAVEIEMDISLRKL